MLDMWHQMLHALLMLQCWCILTLPWTQCSPPTCHWGHTSSASGQTTAECYNWPQEQTNIAFISSVNQSLKCHNKPAFRHTSSYFNTLQIVFKSKFTPIPHHSQENTWNWKDINTHNHCSKGLVRTMLVIIWEKEARQRQSILIHRTVSSRGFLLNTGPSRIEPLASPV